MFINQPSPSGRCPSLEPAFKLKGEHDEEDFVVDCFAVGRWDSTSSRHDRRGKNWLRWTWAVFPRWGILRGFIMKFEPTGKSRATARAKEEPTATSASSEKLRRGSRRHCHGCARLVQPLPQAQSTIGASMTLIYLCFTLPHSIQA